MKIECINLIKSKMARDLLPEQLEKLEKVLYEVLLEKKQKISSHKERKSLIKNYIAFLRLI